MTTVEEKMTAWIDGKLTGKELAEFERELERRPEAVVEKAAAQQIGELLRTHCSAPILQNAEFFNHQLMQRIEADQANAGAPRKTASAREGRFLNLPRMAWAGVFCLLIALMLFEVTISRAESIQPRASMSLKSSIPAPRIPRSPRRPSIPKPAT
jgi:anti-sigma factor RsiW